MSKNNNKSVISYMQKLFIMSVLKLSRRTVYKVSNWNIKYFFKRSRYSL